MNDFLSGRLKAAGAAAAPAWIVTDARGDIVDLNPAAARLLNLSARGALGRNLLPFFVENRPALMAKIQRAGDGVIVDRRTTLQPRDRRAVTARIDVSAVPGRAAGPPQLRWVIDRVGDAASRGDVV